MTQTMPLELWMYTAEPPMVYDYSLNRVFVAMDLTAMEEGVVRFVQTFGNRLTAFQFPHRVAQKLQGYADYF
jgi:hypothetical protein